jgi:glycosyltransferase involved in cell wall biosynthesis
MYDVLGVNANFVYVPNGIKSPLLDFTDKNIARKSFGFSNNDLIFIYVGRIGPEKNLPLLIESFYQFSKLGYSAKLLIVGKGTELKKSKIKSTN